MKQTLDMYGGFKPKNRVQELELFAFRYIDAETISCLLTSINLALGNEYDELMIEEGGESE